MVEKGSFTRCVTELNDKDSSAPSALVARFFNRLVHIARKNLEPRLKAKLDPEDIVQSAFGSFFDRNAAGEFQFEDWDSLGALLAKITIRKCARRANELTTEKRNINRELPNGSDLVSQALGRFPTPEEAAIFGDLLESILMSVKPKYQEVILLKLQRYSNEDISRMVNRTERTVYRILSRLRDRLEAMEADGDSSADAQAGA